MSASQEFLHESLPIAGAVYANPAVLATTAAGIIGAGVASTRLHEKWHDYIDPGQVGVWLNGDALPRMKKETMWIPAKFNPLNLPAYNPFRKVPLTREDVEEDESIYRIVPPGFYWVLPGKKLQPVPTGQQTDLISFERETTPEDKEDRRKLEISASLYWRISPLDDNPVKFLRNIESRKKDKRTDSSWTIDELKLEAKTRVQAAGHFCLGRATRLYSVDRLLDLNDNDLETITENTLDRAAKKLGPLGLELVGIDVNPVVRNDFEVHKQGLESLRGSSPEDKNFAAGSTGGVIGGHGLHLVGGAEPQTDDTA
jgi:hypothetical protein